MSRPLPSSFPMQLQGVTKYFFNDFIWKNYDWVKNYHLKGKTIILGLLQKFAKNMKKKIAKKCQKIDF